MNLDKKTYDRARYIKNKEKIQSRHIERKSEISEYQKSYQSTYQSENRIKLREYKRVWHYNKCNNDPAFKLNKNIRKGIWESLKRNKQGRSWELLVGFSLEQLKTHLESKFENGMNWKNYGEWHVDHVKPICSFDLADVEQFKDCWSLDNLRPLWAVDNLKKSANDKFHARINTFK